MSTTNTPFEEGLDKALDLYYSLRYYTIEEDENDGRKMLTQLHKAAIREARIDENQGWINGLTLRYASFMQGVRERDFMDRIAVLQNKEVKDE